MNIAVVGGGKRCLLLLEFLEKHAFQELRPRVVALADKREDAPCLSKAKEKGAFVTTDYNDLFDRNDIDLIIELTGNDEIFYDILQKKKKIVQAFDHRSARLFWEVGRISDIQEKMKQELDQTRTMYSVLINDLVREDVMVISPSHEILDVNETLLKKLGLSRKEVIGRYCYEISHHQESPCKGEDHPCPLIETLDTQGSSQATHIHLDKDNNEIFYLSPVIRFLIRERSQH